VCDALKAVSAPEHNRKPPSGGKTDAATDHNRLWGVVSLPARPVSAWLARAYLRHWLELANWPDEQLVAIEHAAAEAVSNAVEHAYPAGTPGVVKITMTISTLNGGRSRQARVAVRDRGRWRHSPDDTEHLGRGIDRMTRLVDIATIHRGGYESDHGTEVVLLSVPVGVSETDLPEPSQESACDANLVRELARS